MGLGEIIDTNQILEHDFADLRQLSYMGIATSEDVEGHWIFPESTGNGICLEIVNNSRLIVR